MSSPDFPSITVLIRTYNSQRFIRNALTSALEQSLPRSNYTILVVDDGSTDRTHSILSTYAHLVRVVPSHHRGHIEVLNFGLRLVKTAAVVLLDSDDTFEPTLLEEMQPVLTNDLKTGFVYSDYFEVGGQKGAKKRIHTRDNIFLTVAGGMMFRTKALKECGWFDAKLFFPEYGLLLKMKQHEYQGVHIDKPLYNYRRRPGSTTSDPVMVERGLQELYQRYGVRLPIRKY